MSKIKTETPLAVCPKCGSIYTTESWPKLPQASGGLRMEYDDWSDLELRNCLCGDTLSIYVRNGESL